MKLIITIGDRAYAVVFGKGSMAALLLSGFLISGTVSAEAGGNKVFGIGNSTCESWTAAKAVDHETRTLFLMWMAGYLTAYSGWVDFGSGAVSDITSLDSVWAWMDNYCRDHSHKNVAWAAAEFIPAIEAK